MARPRISTQHRRTVKYRMMHVKVRAAQYSTYVHLADDLGMSLSRLVEELLAAAERRLRGHHGSSR